MFADAAQQGEDRAPPERSVASPRSGRLGNSERYVGRATNPGGGGAWCRRGHRDPAPRGVRQERTRSSGGTRPGGSASTYDALDSARWVCAAADCWPGPYSDAGRNCWPRGRCLAPRNGSVRERRPGAALDSVYKALRLPVLRPADRGTGRLRRHPAAVRSGQERRLVPRYLEDFASLLVGALVSAWRFRQSTSQGSPRRLPA